MELAATALEFLCARVLLGMAGLDTEDTWRKLSGFEDGGGGGGDKRQRERIL